MKTSLSAEAVRETEQKLQPLFAEFTKCYSGESVRRQPVHTVYGGAHLFKAETTRKLGELARRAFETYAPNVRIFIEVFKIPESIGETVYRGIAEKLAGEAVEDFRIDFEDGYGTRSEDEEDSHAAAAARELARGLKEGTLPPFTGFRIKALSEEAHRRSLRTLDIFLTTFVEESGGRFPENFVVTLPKVIFPGQVSTLADVFETLESQLGLSGGSLKMEIMIETTQSLIDERGRANLPLIIAAARGRCTAAHFGAYDYTASCGITAAHQQMFHQACDFARNLMQISLSGTGVHLSDGATNIMPIGPHRSPSTLQQEAENQAVVRRAWKIHYDHVRRSLINGFYQSWDLHPAQLPARYAAVYTFFLENLDQTAERLRNFIAKAAQATLVGDVFDDAATGQGLLNYFIRAINCRALTEQQTLDLTGLSLEELRSGSFARILQNRH